MEITRYGLSTVFVNGWCEGRIDKRGGSREVRMILKPTTANKIAILDLEDINKIEYEMERVRDLK